MRIGAIDQGTTSTRAMLCNQAGDVEILCSLPHRQSHPQSEWVEHDPLELLANIQTCLAALPAVDAVGLTNQGESCLAWDAVTGAPLSPVIVWQDNRTAAEIAALRADGAESLTLERAGLPLDAYFSASKLAWIIGNRPEAADALRQGRLRLGTTDAFFLDRLTGCFATDLATASRTSLMNLETGTWDEDLCRLFGVPVECLPVIRPTAGELGMIGGIPLTASLVDQQAALYGHGCRTPGDAKITFGTGAFALAVTESRIPAGPDGLLPTIAWQVGGKVLHAVDGGVYNAASAVDWAGRMGLFSDVRELASFAAAPAITRDLAFVPALSGLACPHWDRRGAAAWIGMSLDTSKADLCQALLEGVALRTAEVIQAMDDRVPIVESLSVDGGLSRSPYLMQFLADVLGRTIRTSSFDELTAFGCAQMAATALGCDLPRPKSDKVFYDPRIGRDEADAWKRKFSDAISRCRNWRQI
ncbi:MAG TPA: FGGY family carbohydrate kinase [Candidatus Sulfotelmatobacter sp.]|nr:FGGY family carbohydrate kinase [Candidatus Sulfotelmatobacter sp.]